MATDNLEHKISHAHRFRKPLFTMLAVATIAYSAGRVHEAKTHGLEHAAMKTKITKAFYQGYSFHPEADRTFYDYRPLLIKDEKEQLIYGIMVKPDSTNAGPIRKDGHIGLSIPDRAKEYGIRTLETAKEKGNGLIDKAKEQYQRLKEKFHGK